MQRGQVLLLFAVAACCGLGADAYIYHHSVTFTESSHFYGYQRTYMFGEHNDQVEDGESFVAVDAKVAKHENGDQPRFHVAFTTPLNDGALGIKDDKSFKICCSSPVEEKLYSCRRGSVLINNAHLKGGDGPLVYSFPEGAESFSTKLNITQSTDIWVYLIGCPINVTMGVTTVDVATAFRNPYGYIPAEYYWTFGLYLFGTFAYVVYFLVFLGIMIWRRQFLVPLQYLILSVLLLYFVENLGYYLMYEGKNSSGEPPCCPLSWDIIAVSLLNGLAKTCIRMLLLSIGFGLGVVERTLSRRNTILIIVIGVFYFAAASYSETLRFSNTVSDPDVSVWALPETFFNVLFILNIVQAFVTMRAELARAGETVKKEMYDRMWSILKFTGFLVILFFIAEILLRTDILPVVSDPYFISAAGWSLMYLVILTEVTFMWAPSRTVYQLSWYSQAVEIDSDDNADDGDLTSDRPGNDTTTAGEIELREAVGEQEGSADKFVIGDGSSEEEQDDTNNKQDSTRGPTAVQFNK